MFRKSYMILVESTVLANAVDQRVDILPKVATQLLRVRICVNLLADVEPKYECLLKHFVFLVCAAHDEQVETVQVAKLHVGFVDEEKGQGVAELSEDQAKIGASKMNHTC
jgi:hypothetical protein